MKKVANFIGFGTLIAVAVAYLFLLINELTVLGNVFDAFKANGGIGVFSLLSWIAAVAVAAILIIFAVFEILKLVPALSGKDVENKSLVHANTISVFGNGLFLLTMIFAMIIIAIAGGNIGNMGSTAWVGLVFSIIGLCAGLVAILGKDKLGGLGALICALVALFFELVVLFMSLGQGLTLVYQIFLVIGLFGALAYVVVANLDDFKK